MARSRIIKPGFLQNESLADCGPLVHLLFAGLWVHADKAGRMADRPRRIKVQCLPYYDCDVDELLNKLANAPDPFIIRYTVDGARYIQIVNWKRHQTPHHKEQESEIPEPPGTLAVIDSTSIQHHHVVTTSLAQAPNKKKKENKNKEKKEGDCEIKNPPAHPPTKRGGDSELSSGWKGVEEDLLRAGVGAATKACLAASAAGCSTELATAVICFWRLKKPAWSRGTLYSRILNLRPGQDHSELWPPESEESVKIASRAESDQSHARVVQERLEGERRREEDAAERERLELGNGSRLDAMSRKKILAFIHEQFPDNSRMYENMMPPRGHPKGLLRSILLSELDSVPKGPAVVSEAPC